MPCRRRLWSRRLLDALPPRPARPRPRAPPQASSAKDRTPQRYRVASGLRERAPPRHTTWSSPDLRRSYAAEVFPSSRPVRRGSPPSLLPLPWGEGAGRALAPFIGVHGASVGAKHESNPLTNLRIGRQRKKQRRNKMEGGAGSAGAGASNAPRFSGLKAPGSTHSGRTVTPSAQGIRMRPMGSPA